MWRIATLSGFLVTGLDHPRWRGDHRTAQFLQEYADFLEAHFELWTVTQRGTLVPGIHRHYVRINPVNLSNPDDCFRR